MSSSGNFSAFEVRSPVFEPSTPRREGRVPKLNSSWFMDPHSPNSMNTSMNKQSSPNSALRTSTPTRTATTNRQQQQAPFSPMYRSSAVFGTGSRVATPVRRVGTPRTGTPTTPFQSSFSRTVSGTPTFHRTSSGTPASASRNNTPSRPSPTATAGGTPTRYAPGTPRATTPRMKPDALFQDCDYRRTGTPVQTRTPTQRAATPTMHSTRPRTPTDASTIGSNGMTASETSFVSSNIVRNSTTSPREVHRRPSVQQQQHQQQHQQQLYQSQSVQLHRTATPTRHLSGASSTLEASALLSAFVDRWNNRYSENQNNYREGGYMSVAAGELLKQRYVMLQKLGWGEFSTVWLAFDKMAQNPRHFFVAIKIAKCSNSVTESTRYEIALLKFLRESLSQKSPLTHLLDFFEHKGSFGTHQCFVMAVHGSNMLCVIDQMKAKRRRRSEKEIHLIKDITSSVLESLDQLQGANVIHTDLKPENVLCAAPDPKVVKIIEGFLNRNPKLNRDVLDSFTGAGKRSVVLADFGLSVLLEPATVAGKVGVGSKKEFKVHVPGVVSNTSGTLIQTREYRAPEILFGADFNPRSDVWSLGCMVYELITGDFLVDPKKKTRDEREMDVEHLAMIMQIIGPVPHRLACAARGTGAPKYIGRYFNEHGQFLYAEKYKRYQRRSIAAELEVFLEPSEAERAAQFIMSCFTYDPMERCNASDLLKHSWLK